MSEGHVIRYRTVVNDLHVWPWEDMPEVQPPTLTGLINYLQKKCGINPEPLAPDAWRGEGFAVRYGLRKQFWLPNCPTQDELDLMKLWGAEPEATPCPVCTSVISFGEELQAGTTERFHYAYCKKCGLRFSKLNGIAWTAREMASVLKRTAEAHDGGQ